MTDGSGARQFVLPQAFHIHFRDIDPQHEGLVDVINDCADQLVDGELREFESAFSAFVARLTSHFKYEEDQMAELGLQRGAIRIGERTGRGLHRQLA